MERCMAGSSSTAGSNTMEQSCMAGSSSCITGSDTMAQLHGWQQQHSRQQHNGTELHGWQQQLHNRQRHHGTAAWLAAAAQQAATQWNSCMLHVF
eukprot:365857-Chlamydomonas_euryale.AAC.8